MAVLTAVKTAISPQQYVSTKHICIPDILDPVLSIDGSPGKRNLVVSDDILGLRVPVVWRCHPLCLFTIQLTRC